MPDATVGKRVQMNIRVSASLKDWIERLAAQDKRTTNNWVERALAEACERTVRRLADQDQDDVTAGGNPVRGGP